VIASVSCGPSVFWVACLLILGRFTKALHAASVLLGKVGSIACGPRPALIASRRHAQRFASFGDLVVYRYTPSGTNQSKTRSVSGTDFVAGFLQHVLPPGFQKIRYYGWMSPNNRISLDLVRWLVWLYRGWTYWLASAHAPQTELKPPPTMVCPRCGSAMQLVKVIYKNCSLLVKCSTHQQQRFDDSG
jgi:Putative transposase